ncbi:hypothetical protein MNBD_NITROSPINAE04-708 [hydrothermal vent metagenome]|uniref:PRC-barrel domain-containing protein n=1 Tax=hydrothermal vent metagenome TaxID=652676 RepID=A0A3B1CKQ2_9ZZZZ
MGLVTASGVNFDLPHHNMVIGYYIYDNMDKDIADIRDLLIDKETRQPRYAIIEIGGLLSIKGKVVLIPWSALVKGAMSRMDINIPEEQIMAAPTPLDPLAPTRAEEEFIHSYFNTEPYWESEEEEETARRKEVSDSADAPQATTPADDAPITDLTLDSSKND